MIAILRKDIRHLWPQTAGFLLLVCAYGWWDATLPQGRSFQTAQIPGALLCLAIWYMVAILIHQERPVSHRQDWLTRPIPWRSIVIAKCVFIAAFLMLPILLAQMAVLAVNGFPPLDYLSLLLWKQALLLAWIILPPAALAVLTDSLVQFVLAALAVAAFSEDTLVGWRHHWGRVEWVHYAGMGTILLLGLSGMILFEYARRRTGAARAIFGAMAIVYWGAGMIPVPHAALAMGTMPQSGVELQFDPGRRPLGRGGLGLAGTNENVVELMLPIRIDGLPEHMWPLSNYSQLTTDRWVSPWSAQPAIAVVNGAYWAAFFVPERAFDQFKNSPVSVHARIDLNLLSRTAVTELAPGTRATRVQEIGLCSVTGARLVSCFAPLHAGFWDIAGFGFHTVDNLQMARGGGGILPGFSVWLRSIAFDPLQNTPDVAIESYAPTAHFEREFDIPSIVLEHFEVARRRR